MLVMYTQGIPALEWSALTDICAYVLQTTFFLILTGIISLIIDAVDKMLERKEEYQQRYSDLYNQSRCVILT